MNTFLQAALANALLALPLAAVALAAGRFLNRPALTHALWVLVLLKLVTPPVLDVPMIPAHLAPSVLHAPDAHAAETAMAASAALETSASAPPPSDTATQAIAAGAASVGPAEAVKPSPPPIQVTLSDSEAASGSEFTTAPPVTPAPSRHASLRLGLIVSFIWLVGAAGVAVLQLHRLVRFRRFLRCAVDSPELDDEAVAMAAAMGLKSPPRVRLLPGVVSPMLWGVGPWTSVLFPARLAERLDADGRASLLAHELAHHGRGDQWVRLLELAAGVLYWWHPAVWLARRGIEAAGEDCADAWVVERFRSRPRCYAAALLDTVDFLAAGPSVVVPGVTGLGTAAALRHRLVRIMQGPSPRVLSRPGRAAILLLVVTLPLQPALIEFTGSESLASVTAQLDPTDLFDSPVPDDSAEPAAATSLATYPPLQFPEPLAPLPDEHVWATAASADGRFALRVRLDGSATLHDARGLRPMPMAGAHFVAADFSPDGAMLATADSAGRLALWDTTTGTIKDELPPSSMPVRSIAFSAQPDRLAIGDDAGVTVWNLPARTSTTLPPPGGPVTCVRFSDDSRTLAAACGQWTTPATGRILLWNGRSWSTLAADVSAAALAFTAGGLAVASWDGRVALHDLDTGVVAGVAWVEKDAVSAASFSPAAGGLADLAFLPETPSALAIDTNGIGFGLPLPQATDGIQGVAPSYRPTAPAVGDESKAITDEFLSIFR